MKSGNVAVLVNSCDAYSDIWQYFFHFVDTYWEDCPYRFYLNTETLSYDYKAPCGEKLRIINTKSGMPWSKRLLKALDGISEEYVIHILDDSFLLEKVNQSVIDKCVFKLDNDKNIGCFHFEERLPNPYLKKANEFGFREMDKRENYLASAYVTLWRKSFLKKVLRAGENAWQFELYGTIRCRHYKERIYALSETSNSVIHYYIKGNGGYGISGGKWAPNTVNLFKEHNLVCDFSVRGFYDADENMRKWIENDRRTFTLKQKLLMPFTDRKLFVEKASPKIHTILARIDIKGRITNLF